MWENIKWLRITPDRAGRGGTKTGFHSFQQTPINDVRSLFGGHIYRGYWRRDIDSINYPGEIPDGTAANCLMIHGYTFPSLTDPAAPPTIKILEQNVHLGGVSVVYDTNGTIRQSRPGTNQQGTFVNIAGRCFFGDGGTEGLIMDDRTPAIHAQPNQPLGISAPLQPLPLNSAGNVTSLGTGYVHNTGGANTSPYLNHPDPNNQLSTCIAGDTVTVDFPDPNSPGNAGTPPGPATLAVGGVTSNTTPFTATGTVSINTNTSLVTLTGATWPANFQYAGLAINFNGYSFVVLTHGPDLTAFNLDGGPTTLTSTQLEILGVYDGPTIPLPGIPYTITGCQVILNAAGNSGATQINAGVLGYSQSTNAKLVQMSVQCVRANGFFRNLGNISLGPENAIADTGSSIQSLTDGTLRDGKKRLGSASGPFVAADEGAPMFVDQAGAAGGTLSTTIAQFITANAVILTDPNISGTSFLGNAQAWWGAQAVISDGDMAIGVNDLTSASNPFVPGDVGQPIVVERAGAGGIALITTIATYVGPGHVTLTDANASGVHVTGAQVWWRGVSINTHAGPTYAYSWYDPETGHSSNISPMFQIPRPTNIGQFTDFANVTPFFQIDPGYISYPSGVDATRFSHLLFFRTLSTPGSSTLYPIGSLMPFVGKVHPGGPSTRGSWSPNTYHGWSGLPNNYVNAPTTTGTNYWYDFSSDQDLLLTGGFRAPQFTNNKPVALLRGGVTQPGYPYAMAYWDRRLWLVDTQEPNKILFSCDEAQCPLGVPEESFPPTNFLRLPSAADGKVLGMRTVGDMLLITTQQLAYIVTGNNESNYRLMKISSSMPGVGTYQMDEFPSYAGAEGEPTTVFFLGVDRIVYQWTIGGTVTPISQGIQDQLDQLLVLPAGQYTGSLVHCISAWGRRLVVVAPHLVNGIGIDGVQTFIYDINTGVWSTSIRNGGSAPSAQNAGVVPMTTVYGAGNVPVNELYGIKTNFGLSTGVHAVSWIRDDVTSSSLPMRIDTFPLAFDGKKTRKQIVAVNLHASAGVWTGTINPNDQSGSAITFSTYPDPVDSIYAPTGIQQVGDDVFAQDLVVLAGAFNTDGTPIICYRVSLAILKSLPDVEHAQLYAIDVGYVDMENPGEGDA